MVDRGLAVTGLAARRIYYETVNLHNCETA